jgi:hypothetical protein
LQHDRYGTQSFAGCQRCRERNLFPNDFRDTTKVRLVLELDVFDSIVVDTPPPLAVQPT